MWHCMSFGEIKKLSHETNNAISNFDESQSDESKL